MFQRIIKQSYIALFVCIASSFAFGQDLKQDMAEIGEKMENASTVAITVDVKMYNKKGGSTIYAGKAGIVKSEESTKSTLGEMEFISTPEFELRVDHEERELLIFKKQAPSDTKIQEGETMELDVEALKKLIESDQESQKKPKITLKSNVSGVKTYSITEIEGMAEVILVIDMNSKKVKTVKFEYGSASSRGQYVVLNYTKFSFDSDVSKEFDLTSYFTESEGKFILDAKLKGYQIFTDL